MKFEFHPETRLEFLDAVAHYETIQSDLGERFIESIDAVIEDISEHPEAWTEIEQGVRRKLTRVFPYALLYTIEPDHILIMAVMHCHQEPGYWRARLDG